MAITFDGVNKLIVLSGVTDLVVQDMYSQWIDWIAVSDNIKYLPAIRFVGGDAVSPTKDLGITYFLVNGWKIRPQEADHRLVVEGNLYTDPAGESPFVGTLGNFNVVIEMQVSNLVDSTVTQLDQINASVYRGEVSIDVAAGVSGTVFPIGTQNSPVNNITDALIIADTYGIKTFSVVGLLTLVAGDNVAGYKIKGRRNPLFESVLIESGAIVAGCEFEEVAISGTPNTTVNCRTCIVNELTNVNGVFYRCIFTTFPVTLVGAESTTMVECHSASPNPLAPVIIDMGGGGSTLAVRAFNGDIYLRNRTSYADICLDMHSGQVTLDPTLLGVGNIVIRGNCTLVNNTTAPIIKGLIPQQVWDEVL